MPWYIENARSTTGTALRSRDPSPLSGMCPICIRECGVLCEVGKSALRGREVLYPSPEYYGHSTAASNKDYLLNWGDLQIQVEVLGAEGVEADPEHAIFPNVDITSKAGGVPLKTPVIIAGLGSTEVAKRQWEGIAGGAALAGTIQVIGENVCGMDLKSEYTPDGKIHSCPDLKWRVDTYRKYWDGTHGDIAVQTNVEDQRAGVDLYALQELGVNIIERKWGQGAKAIGGEVRIDNLEQALLLKKRGYVLVPDPEDPDAQEAFNKGIFKTFERHSRVGFPEEKEFIKDIAWLREKGAKKVFLKTGAYNGAVVGFTLRCASQAKIDLLTFDGAGGGTGMSPVPMMNECSTPTIYLLAQVLEGVRVLRAKGKYVPDIAIAGGFANETQIFKAIAMSNLGDGEGPVVKAIAMARAPLTASMKSDYFVELAAQGKLPGGFAKLYGGDPEQFFIGAGELGHNGRGKPGKDIPWPTVGVYTYFTDRIGVGLRQLMAGCRKWKINLLDRSDLASLTERAARVTGIPLMEELDKEVMHKMLDF
ncbi:MAG: FMN-binding glutamate synthase family protein [Armatimonadetes bacterium]|nr:FMN-binding glutamate synthase family protein [Armatimonadota bacterium]NIM22852.1 FMN-binding glutamate synthase family protein [Armatimonadota bacterium]NIM66718.1 FMN-binding glutamate synthase family protein [Armatimonadota bacterium]NIM75275.1 FMN-binding glutamate synthase family protein [Armatimonadota bacterium]NIN04915.1 FMN-binding glutamate synthase family protein [Armatimonadota bacterium]